MEIPDKNIIKQQKGLVESVASTVECAPQTRAAARARHQLTSGVACAEKEARHA
jgi:hypothetical protein